MTKTLLICTVVIILCLATAAQAESVRTTTWLKFTWEPVTQNADGTPCDDLAGYAIYRSRVSGQWNDLTGKEAAYRLIPLGTAANQSEYACWCHEPGTWFFIIRAYDITDQFSDKSNEVEAFVDASAPGTVTGAKICVPGDLDCDGDIDGNDLAEFSIKFGGN